MLTLSGVAAKGTAWIVVGLLLGYVVSLSRCKSRVQLKATSTTLKQLQQQQEPQSEAVKHQIKRDYNKYEAECIRKWVIGQKHGLRTHTHTHTHTIYSGCQKARQWTCCSYAACATWQNI